MKRTLFLLLTMCMLVSFSVAFAENGYEQLQQAITESIGLGTVSEIDELPDNQTISVLFYSWDNQVELFGLNENNHPEYTQWNTELCAPLFGGYCGSWDTIISSVEPGYKLNFILQTEENGDLLLIDTSEKAKIMYDAILNQ